MQKAVTVTKTWLLEKPPAEIPSGVFVGSLTGTAMLNSAVRLESSGDSYTMTKDECTWQLDKSAWEALLPLAGSRTLFKSHYIVGDGRLNLNLVLYNGRHTGLALLSTQWQLTMEYEEAWSESTREAVFRDSHPEVFKYSPPVWLGETIEITGDSRYSDETLICSSAPLSPWKIAERELEEAARAESLKRQKQEMEQRRIENLRKHPDCRNCQTESDGLCYDHDYGLC